MPIYTEPNNDPVINPETGRPIVDPTGHPIIDPTGYPVIDTNVVSTPTPPQNQKNRKINKTLWKILIISIPVVAAIFFYLSVKGK